MWTAQPTLTHSHQGEIMRPKISSTLVILAALWTYVLYIIFVIIVKPESKSPIPCPNRPQILTLRSDQV